MATEPYWEGWFKGMSQLFLLVPVPKILMLAGSARVVIDGIVYSLGCVSEGS